jgi:hypothetical protein
MGPQVIDKNQPIILAEFGTRAQKFGGPNWRGSNLGNGRAYEELFRSLIWGGHRIESSEQGLY